MSNSAPAANRHVLRVPLDVPGVESEQLAVEPLGGGHFLVLSIPAVASDPALGDVVRARPVDEILEFTGVAVPGGNRTLRVLVDAPLIDQLHPRLEALGCRVDNPVPELLAVNIPPDAPGEGIRAYLQELVDSGQVHLAPGDVGGQ